MKRRSKRKRKSGINMVWISLVLIGVGIGAFFLFRQEISHLIKPGLEKKEVSEQKREVTLYFSDEESECLMGEKRRIYKKGGAVGEAEELLHELIRGPKSNLLPTLPPKTRLLSIKLDDKGIARINFNRALSKDHPGGSSAEMMTVYSVVNSLTLNFPEVKGVQFLIEGKEIETITGHLALNRPVFSKPDLIRKPKGNRAKH